MLAYNKNTLEHVALQRAADQAANYGLIPIEKEKEIKDRYPVDLYTPNIFVCFGLGLLTIFIVLAAVGLLELITNFKSPIIILLIAAVGSFAVLTYMTGTRKHFSSGVDHVLMTSTIAFTTATIVEMFSAGLNNDVLAPALVCILSFWFMLRFADSIMAATAFIAAIYFVVTVWAHFAFSAMIVLPFLVMFLAALVYVACKRLNPANHALFYLKSLFVLQLLALLAFYLSGNYFIVDKFLKEIVPAKNAGLPGVSIYFFWAFTLLIPVIYVVAGIRFKSLILCRIGIICLAISILTYRYYYSVFSPEVAMIVAGVLLTLIAYWFTRFLKHPAGGFVFRDVQVRKSDTANIEGVIIAETFGQKHTAEQHSTSFNGGSFGGGGAGERY